MQTRVVTAFVLLFIAFICREASAQYGQPIPCPADLKIGFDSITEAESRSHLSVLAGKDCAGRGTGQIGYQRAAEYVAKRLIEMGLGPVPATAKRTDIQTDSTQTDSTQTDSTQKAGYQSLFQFVPLQQRSAIAEHCDITAAGKIKIPAAGNIGFDSYSATPSVDGQVVFANCPQGRFRFPQTTDFRGRVVLYQVDDRNFSYVQRKIEQYGPLATFRIVDSVPQSVGQILTERSSQEPIRGSITRPSATELIRRLGFAMPARLRNDQKEAELTHTHSNVVINNPTRVTTVNVPNVAAWLPGSAPELQDEYIIIGAHLDHLGVGSATTFYGADDNSSGSTALLEIAEALVANPLKPKRSVLLMWFAAEEHGLLGSDYYCNHPIADPGKMIAMLNIDMMGRNESSLKETAQENEGSIHLVGSQKGGGDLHDVIMDANQYVGFRFEYDEESVFSRSDQYNFFKQGVQVAFLFGGFHPDYHRDTDNIDKINFPKIVSAARLFYITLFNATERGRFGVNSLVDQPQTLTP